MCDAGMRASPISRRLHACRTSAVLLSLLVLLAACGPSSEEPKAAAGAPGDADAGRRLFSICANCHQAGPAARAGFGPQLNGIVGRPAGSTADYHYSAAMQNAGFVWTEEKLRAFVKDPDAVVPGNKMRFFGIRSERELNDLLAYLRSIS
jgi:cytochrome c